MQLSRSSILESPIPSAAKSSLFLRRANHCILSQAVWAQADALLPVGVEVQILECKTVQS
jgi:hypothetical protein